MDMQIYKDKDDAFCFLFLFQFLTPLDSCRRLARDGDLFPRSPTFLKVSALHVLWPGNCVCRAFPRFWLDTTGSRHLKCFGRRVILNKWLAFRRWAVAEAS